MEPVLFTFNYRIGFTFGIKARHWGWGCLLLLLACQPVFAQNADPNNTEAEANNLIVSRVRFRGNKIFTKEQLDARARTHANRRFLLIPGFTWWLWLHRLGDSGLFGNRVGQALKATGEPPAYLDEIVLAQDVERLQLFYQQAGFRHAKVTARIDTLANQRLEVTFDIDQGQPTFVRRVKYDIDALDERQQRQLSRASLLINDKAAFLDPLTFEPEAQWFSEGLLHEERRRILGFLRNEGFAAITRDSVRAIIDSVRTVSTEVAPDSFDVIFWVRPGPRYKFGDIHYEIKGPESGVPSKAYLLDEPSEADYGVISAQITGDSKLKTDLLKRTLLFQPGEWYNQSKILSTKRRLEASGIFVLSRFAPQWADTFSVGIPPTLAIPYQVDLETQERHQMRFDTFLLQRDGVFSASDNELGTGIGVAYENANLLGSAEQFRFSTTGSIAADIDSTSTLFTSAQAEVSTSLTLPYLITPFHGLDDRFNLYDARTQLSLSFLTARREELRFVIRGRGTARLRLEMQHSPTVASYVDVFDFSLSNPDTLAGFQTEFLGQILGSIDNPVQRAQILEDYTKPQINTALRYTLRSATVNPLRRDQGFSSEGSFEFGGNLPYFLDRWVHTPGTLEGRIPGLSLFRGSDAENSLIYRQYIRMTLDFRQYKRISRNSVMAWKTIGGIAHPTGRGGLVPFDRRFYSGGASSVRGWGLRELGPGRTTADSTSSILGGDVKLEASIELRSTILRQVFAADWILTLFSDAGNVWFGPKNPGDSGGRFRASSFYKEIGVGGGFGMRLAWEYLIIRLDLAYRIHDPAHNGRFVDNTFRGPRLHFGIGHAF